MRQRRGLSCGGEIISDGCPFPYSLRGQWGQGSTAAYLMIVPRQSCANTARAKECGRAGALFERLPTCRQPAREPGENILFQLPIMVSTRMAGPHLSTQHTAPPLAVLDCCSRMRTGVLAKSRGTHPKLLRGRDGQGEGWLSQSRLSNKQCPLARRRSLWSCFFLHRSQGADRSADQVIGIVVI